MLAAIGDAITTAGGVCTRCDAEGAVAVFGIAIDATTACREALDAARSIERGLAALNIRLTEQFGFAADVALVVHAGPAAVGAIGYGPKRAKAIVGPVLDDARRLRRVAVTENLRFIASGLLLRRAGVPTDALRLDELDGDEKTSSLGYVAAASAQALQPVTAATP